MADPQKYQRGFSFSGYQATNPSKPLPGPSLDSELEDIEDAVDSLADSIRDIRRADGALKNGIVTADSLHPALTFGFTIRGAWTAGEAYAVGEGVVLGDNFYRARVSHVASAENQPDVDTETWIFLFEAGVAIVGDGTITETKLADSVKQGAPFQWPTKAAAQAAAIPAVVTAIRVGDYNYRAVADTGTLQVWQFRSNANTRRWELVPGLGTVEMYGAVGDGVADDKPAFLAMLAHTGTIRLAEKRYNVNGLSLVADNVAIIGARKPAYDAAYTKLEQGSVLHGTVGITAKFVHVENFGVDAGTASGLASTTEGFTVKAPAGQLGYKFVARNIATLGGAPMSATHSLVVEGFDANDLFGIDIANRYYGVVVKGRRTQVGRVRYRDIGGAGVFIKSDVPASGGFVLNATVQNAIVTDVIGQMPIGNTEGVGVYVMASTSALSSVIVSGVDATYGLAAVRVAGGGGAIYASDVQISNVKSVGQVTGVDLFGDTYEVVCTNLQVTNPSTAKAFRTSTTSTNWQFSNINLLISDNAITGVAPADFNGTGVWDNFSVRNAYRQMVMTFDFVSVICGTKRGNVIIQGEGPLTGKNGAGTGDTAPRAEILPGNLVKLTGKLSLGTITGPIATIPAGGAQKFMPAVSKTGTSTYGVSMLWVQGTDLLLLQGAAGAQDVDLTGVTYRAGI